MPHENSSTDSEGHSLMVDLSGNEDNRTSYHDILSDTSKRTSSIPPSRPSLHGTRTTTQRHTPRDRFKASVKKVIQMRRASTIISRYGEAGAEPGVDPRRSSADLQYGHIRQNCLIELVDYSTIRTSFRRMTNSEFVTVLNDETAGKREPWVRVRWINVCGISWDVVSALAIHYDLHPLAVEDILQQGSRNRSKADYYPKHLFIRILSHTLDDPENHSVDASQFILEDVDDRAPLRQPVRRATSPAPMTPADYSRKEGLVGDSDSKEQPGSTDEDRTVFGSAPATWARAGPGMNAGSRRGGVVKRRAGDVMVDMRSGSASVEVLLPSAHRGSASRKRREKAQNMLEELKKESRVPVKVQPVCVFLLRNGTVISILPQNYVDFAGPIMARLRQPDTGLRTSSDASLLVQGILDLIVDSAFEVVDAFHEKILELEQDVLMKPDMKVVSRLHIISGDLTMHKRTLEPLKTVIYGLRRYDVDRSAVLLENGPMDQKVEGFMSRKANIYLADVHDHVDHILTSIDMFAGIAENLINYTFNVKSYEMNEVMRRLTMATIIFLPLTLLTGYFGMNFEAMWSVDLHSDLLFWEIAIPVMIVIIPLFTWPDIKRVVHYVKKRLTMRKHARETAKLKSS